MGHPGTVRRKARSPFFISLNLLLFLTTAVAKTMVVMVILSVYITSFYFGSAEVWRGLEESLPNFRFPFGYWWPIITGYHGMLWGFFSMGQILLVMLGGNLLNVQ